MFKKGMIMPYKDGEETGALLDLSKGEIELLMDILDGRPADGLLRPAIREEFKVRLYRSLVNGLEYITERLEKWE